MEEKTHPNGVSYLRVHHRAFHHVEDLVLYLEGGLGDFFQGPQDRGGRAVGGFKCAYQLILLIIKGLLGLGAFLKTKEVKRSPGFPGGLLPRN